MKDKHAIGNNIGRPTPYIIVTQTIFISLEYLKSILKLGPAYMFMY
jgi:hypothetical protein